MLGLTAAAMIAVVSSTLNAALPAMLDGKELPTLAPLIEKVSPAVVNIAVSGEAGPPSPLCQDPFFSQFPQCQNREFRGGGSGVIVDADNGYILTNHHVVENASTIRITLLDNRTLEGEVVGSDPLTDIAVLKVKPNNLQAMPLADSDQARVGDFVVAIGNPFGLQHTVTSGIISALGRSGINPDNYEDFIQTDAAINMGNSGGALINLNGELLGINSAIISNSGGSVGIGFAIPVKIARGIMDQLLQYGEVRRGLLGVSIQSIDSDLAENLGLEEARGALVSQVMPDSAAEKAGIMAGDVILSVNGEPVTSAAELRVKIGMQRAGEKVKVELVRDGKSKSVTAVLGQAEAETIAPAELHQGLEGARFEALDSGHEQFDGTEGLLVTAVEQGSPAYRNGLRVNDIVLRINRQRVRTLDDLRQFATDSASLLLQIRRGNSSIVLAVR
jgi:serine protease Do/serine protease DegQ